MLRSRFALAFSALALVLGCGDDATTKPSNNLDFGGVDWVAPDETGKLVVAWTPHKDAADYRIYVSRIRGRELKTVPLHSAPTAPTSLVLTPDEPDERYYVIVRAADAAGIEDANTIAKSALATPDETPPTFPGAKTAEPAGNAGAKITWDPATDDTSPPEAIVYDVYAGRSPQTMARIATTAPGDTSITFNQLGSPTEAFTFAVRARDIAHNESVEDKPVRTVLGQDATKPSFAGCDTATSLRPTTASVTWLPALDNFSPASALTYDIYVSTASQQHGEAAPAVSVVAGTSATLTGLVPGATYFVRCKVRDAAGNVDANTTERTFTTAGDVTKPVFAGIKTFKFDEVNRTAEFTWDPATDQPAGGSIFYDVFESRISGTYDFNAPPRASTTKPNETSIVLNDVSSRSTLYWIVRARDATGNRDTNTVEKSGTTLTSYSVDVQNVFNRSCAVVGCHVTGPQAGGLNLSPAFSYAQLVNVTSNLNRPMVRVSKDKDLLASWLYLKITNPEGKGLLMPAPQTGNALTVIDKDIIISWILQGALNN